VGPDYDMTTGVKTVWHDGEPAGFALHNIAFLSNKRYRSYIKRFIENGYGYGDIICDVDVGNPLLGDANGDGVVNEGDWLLMLANAGRRVGIDPLAVPLDVNGDGEIGLARDRDRDGYIATSERIYNDAWTLVHTTGDWMDTNGDGKNDLDSDGSGQYDMIERALRAMRLPPHAGEGNLYLNALLGAADLCSSAATGGYRYVENPAEKSASGVPRRSPAWGVNGSTGVTSFSDGVLRFGLADAVNGVVNLGGGTPQVQFSRQTSALGDPGDGSGDTSRLTETGAYLVRGSEIPPLGAILDADGDGIMDVFDADGDGFSDLVPASLDPNGDGVVNELDAAYIGYNWGETTFEELWIPLPAPEWD